MVNTFFWHIDLNMLHIYIFTVFQKHKVSDMEGHGGNMEGHGGDMEGCNKGGIVREMKGYSEGNGML